MKHPLLILLVALCLLSLGQAAWYYPQLPGLVATHFDATGRANGWMPPAHFFQSRVVFTLGFTAFFAALAFAAAQLPAPLIPLPHKEYWLNPRQRDETKRQITNMILSSGCGGLAFFLFCYQRVHQANLNGPHHLTPSFGVILITALALIAGPLVSPLLRFWKTGSD
ncbi:MAG: DUF1648 domain-containing protein [Opitutaceae bacterium]|jgi:uncharacterized membrane protein